MQAIRVLSGGDMQQGAMVVANPLDQDYLDMPPKGTLLAGPEGEVVTPRCWLSINEDGSFGARALTVAPGPFEKPTKQGLYLVYTCWNDEAHGHPRFLIPFAE